MITFQFASQNIRDYNSDIPKMKIFFSCCAKLQQAEKILEIEISFIKTELLWYVV